MEFYYEENKIYVENDDKEIVALVTFPFLRDGVININHTFVSESLRGMGIASELILSVYNDAKKKGYKIIASCSYAVKWFEKNQDKQDILVNK